VKPGSPFVFVTDGVESTVHQSKKAQAVMQTMLKMGKIDIAELRRAYEQG